jgi:hypothetical protein
VLGKYLGSHVQQEINSSKVQNVVKVRVKFIRKGIQYNRIKVGRNGKIK